MVWMPHRLTCATSKEVDPAKIRIRLLCDPMWCHFWNQFTRAWPNVCQTPETMSSTTWTLSLFQALAFWTLIVPNWILKLSRNKKSECLRASSNKWTRPRNQGKRKRELKWIWNEQRVRRVSKKNGCRLAKWKNITPNTQWFLVFQRPHRFHASGKSGCRNFTCCAFARKASTQSAQCVWDTLLAGHYAARKAQVLLFQQHLRPQYSDRMLYWESRGVSRLRGDRITLIGDAMDMNKFAIPRSAAVMRGKEFSTFQRVKLSVSCVLAHGHFALFVISMPGTKKDKQCNLRDIFARFNLVGGKSQRASSPSNHHLPGIALVIT